MLEIHRAGGGYYFWAGAPCDWERLLKQKKKLLMCDRAVYGSWTLSMCDGGT